MLEIRFEKTNYAAGDGPSGEPSDFEVCVSTACHFESAPLTRQQLERLHASIGRILRDQRVPKYTVENRSSIAAVLAVLPHEHEPDR